MKKLISFITALSLCTAFALPSFAENVEDPDMIAYHRVLGDVNGDGETNVTDINLMNAHVKGIRALDEAQQRRADIVSTEGGIIDVTDLSRLTAYVKGISGEKDAAWNAFLKVHNFIQENGLHALIYYGIYDGRADFSVDIDGSVYLYEQPEEIMERHGQRAYDRLEEFMEKNGISEYLSVMATDE
ncbi:dockerin type I repeat-containing protein [Ruminococcus sp.]|uniref:dockerin type I repeat-containing protein n=1 Tax=Ruminococcus sp. TaxID=41978 RepID=UPI0025F238E9|nr:dockerin type I repeat-containing protein [Ruminococcus sp.]MBQ8966531.1 dockerin type I repeat-containing protein [Ruminococcus sp.]